MVHTSLVEWAGGNSHKEECKVALFLTVIASITFAITGGGADIAGQIAKYLN